jgi:hypothetical protein
MKKILTLFAVSALIVILDGCDLKGHPSQTYDYLPLEEYRYTPANIQPGTEVQLLAFSGGKEADKKDLYYYQFIVLDRNTGDTLRILAPLISVDKSAGVDDKTFTTPLQYNPEKGITNAFYELMDSTQNLVLQVDALIKDDNNDSSVDINSLMSKVDKKQFVVINKSMSEFENPNYRTAIGVLNFKRIPW